MKVGLIGYGMAGQVFHAPVIAAIPSLRLTKVIGTAQPDLRDATVG